MCARLFAGASTAERLPSCWFSAVFFDLVQPSLMAQADHFLDENNFLLVVQACKQGLGRIGDAALIHRAIVEKLGLVAHLLDNIVGRVTLGARNSQVETIGAVMAEVMHRAVEA